MQCLQRTCLQTVAQKSKNCLISYIQLISAKKNRKIYISGKISGTDDYLERFAAAEKKFSEQGYEVVNPAYEGTKLKDASYEDYMELSFQLLKDCDIIYMLKDWRTSPGANQEYGYALAKDMEIRFEK